MENRSTFQEASLKKKKKKNITRNMLTKRTLHQVPTPQIIKNAGKKIRINRAHKISHSITEAKREQKLT